LVRVESGLFTTLCQRRNDLIALCVDDAEGLYSGVSVDLGEVGDVPYDSTGRPRRSMNPVEASSSGMPCPGSSPAQPTVRRARSPSALLPLLGVRAGVAVAFLSGGNGDAVRRRGQRRLLGEGSVVSVAVSR